MKWLLRLFFKTLRAALGPLLLAGNWLTTPKGVVRPETEQRALDELTGSLTLYQFNTCPFCIKVRRAIKRLSLRIETRDARRNPQHREELLQGGGQIKVPCLKIVDDQGNATWLYESNDIIAHLQDRYAQTESA
ncbi:MAG TPA: glutaredoxin [Betaproteobacteria bacterium]|nr:glutaredoxin [Betaproteobacteria bacterium]